VEAGRQDEVFGGVFMNGEETFEERKERVLREAREEGVVDVSTALLEGSFEKSEVSLDTIELATRLMKERGEEIYGDLWGDETNA
jgi:hypothetical protein